jgi:hypothetical protein
MQSNQPTCLELILSSCSYGTDILCLLLLPIAFSLFYQVLDIIQLFDYRVFGLSHHSLLASDLFQLISKIGAGH